MIITTELIRDYLLNYARPLIYTTSQSYASVIAADASFDLLEDGTADKLTEHLFSLSSQFISTLQPRLVASRIPPSLLSLPAHLTTSSSTSSPSTISPRSPKRTDLSPIIPLLTSHPRPLSAHLLSLGMNARPITWPTVPKGKGRVRVCLHAGNTKEEVEKLVHGCMEWAEGFLRQSVDARAAGDEGDIVKRSIAAQPTPMSVQETIQARAMDVRLAKL